MCKIWVLVLCLFSTATIVGQQTKPLTLTGRVVDSRSQPVVGAEVAAYEKFRDDSSKEYSTILLGRIRRTDANGHFAINAEIYLQRNVVIVVRKEGLALGWDGFESSPGDKQGNFNIVLEPPCSMAGMVVNEAGEPIAGADVRAVPKTSYLDRLRQRPIFAAKEWFTTRTNEEGEFSFTNLAVDVSSDFQVEAPGWASVYKYTTHNLTSCGFAVGQKDVCLVLPPETKLHGRVVDEESNNPITGVSVSVRPDPVPFERDHPHPYCPHLVLSGLNGQFNVEGIPVGRHRVRVISRQRESIKWVGKESAIDVQADQATKDIVVYAEKGGIVEVVVRERTTEEPLNNIPVLGRKHGDRFYSNTRTDTSGIAHIRLPRGECDIGAGGGDYSYYKKIKAITIIKGQTTRLEILLDRNPSVSGVVLDEYGQPVAGALVKGHWDGDEVLTTKNGKFEVGLHSQTPCERLFVRSVERNLSAIAELKEPSGSIIVTLKPALSITGQVTDTDSVGIPAARVSLWPCGPEVLTDAQGRYQMRAILPEQTGGDYLISVNASGYGVTERKRIAIMGEPGAPVEMKTIALQRADQSISGVVVDAEGKPAARVPIILRGRGQRKRSTTTDGNGRFSIDRVCKGPLRIQVGIAPWQKKVGSLVAQGGDSNMKAILGQNRIHTEHISLIGKPLPELKDLKIALPANADNKMILVCFFDMNQRPSRYCITQLTKQTAQLRQKGITLVAIQASKIDEKKLNEWVKKNDIPFPTGMFEGDEEEIRFAWGVRSLPWLILTDAKHIVRAVGFGIDQLDTELAKTDQPITKEEIEKHQREVAEVEIRRLGGEIVVKTSENGSEYTEVKFLGPRYQNEWKGANLGAKYLHGLCNLKNLRIQDVETFTDEGMVYLEGLDNLESLMLVRTQVTDNGLAHIKELTNLEFLGLFSNRFTDTGLEHIIGMTELKSLRFDDAQITNDGLKRLKQNGLLGALEFLSLNRTKISNEGLAHLTGMQNLKRLYLSDTQITSVGLDYIGGLTKLEVLILTNTDISDEGLLHLKTLTNLNMLYLRNTQITNTGLAHLEKMTNLVQLWISGTKITDAGLVYLKALNKLESLDLSHTQVTNSGLSHLEGLTSLNELFLNYSGVTVDGYLDLNEALPDCQIYWEQKKDGEVGAAKEKIHFTWGVKSLP